MVYNIIMYFKNLENKIIKNVLSEDQIKFLYNIIDNAHDDEKQIMPWLGQTTFFLNFSDDLEKTILNIINNFVGEEMQITEMSLARYHTDSGFTPKLFPHYDHFEESRVTFDVQLKSNIDWPIVVENKKYLLKNNEALIFSGTDQIHWRSPKTLSKNDFVDMLFVHLSRKNNNNKITDEQKNERETRCMDYRKNIGIPIDAIEVN